MALPSVASWNFSCSSFIYSQIHCLFGGFPLHVPVCVCVEHRRWKSIQIRSRPESYTKDFVTRLVIRCCAYLAHYAHISFPPPLHLSDFINCFNRHYLCTLFLNEMTRTTLFPRTPTTPAGKRKRENSHYPDDERKTILRGDADPANPAVYARFPDDTNQTDYLHGCYITLNNYEAPCAAL